MKYESESLRGLVFSQELSEVAERLGQISGADRPFRPAPPTDWLSSSTDSPNSSLLCQAQTYLSSNYLSKVEYQQLPDVGFQSLLNA